MKNIYIAASLVLALSVKANPPQNYITQAYIDLMAVAP